MVCNVTQGSAGIFQVEQSKKNIIRRLSGCMMPISYFSDFILELSVKFCIKNKKSYVVVTAQ